MQARSFNRSSSQTRPLKITPRYSKFVPASAMIEYGDTRVLCTATVENTVPFWMRGTRGQGWLNAEYSLLPGSTPDRSRRERNGASGRTMEIQRLIGRSLRAVLDLKQLGERTITIDCDVIQADGGTRTAAITGAYVALKLAIDGLLKQNRIKTNPLIDSVAAVSVGIVNEAILVDLDYEEDLAAAVDFNVVATGSGMLIEVQGTAEKTPFSREKLDEIVETAQNALVDIFSEQTVACN